MSSDFEEVLRRWVVRYLGVRSEDVAAIETEVIGGCWNGTCEFNTTSIDVTLTNGRKYRAEQEFGLFLEDLVRLDLNEDGTPRRRGRPPLFALAPAD